MLSAKKHYKKVTKVLSYNIFDKTVQKQNQLRLYVGIFCSKKHLNSPRIFFKDLEEPEGFPHGLKVPRPRLKHGSCDELSRIFLFFVSHPDEA